MGFCAALAVCVWSVRRVEALSTENQNLRTFNARRDRRLNRPPASPRWESIEQASHILGTAPSVIAGVWYAENGPPDIETGSLGKTDAFVGYPIQDWAALEAGRTMNRLSWEWFTQTPEGRRALPFMLKSAAGPYTAMGEYSQRQWVQRILKEVDSWKHGKKLGPAY